MQGPREYAVLARRRVLAGGAGLLLAPLGGCLFAEPPPPMIGYLDTVPIDYGAGVDNLAAFRQGLISGGLVEDSDFTIQARASDGRAERLPALAKELVDLNAAVLFAGSPAAARAAQAATRTIPIIIGQAGDAVENGELANPARPEGNLTGIANYNDLDSKRLSLLDPLVPAGVRIAYLSDSSMVSYGRNLRAVEEEAVRLKRPLMTLKAGNDTELAVAYNRLGGSGVGGLLAGSIRGLRGRPRRLVELATRHGLPAIYFNRTFVEAGGLMSYGAAYKQICRLAGIYAARILKGAAPADLPLLQPNAFELVINREIARIQGVRLPPELLAEASEIVG